MNDFERLFDLRGIAPNFWNYKGEHVAVPTENRLLIAQAMGIDTSNEESVSEHILMLERWPWEDYLPALTVTQLSNPSLVMSFPSDELAESVKVTVKDYNDMVVVTHSITPSSLNELDSKNFADDAFSKRELHLDPLSIGYYTIALEVGSSVSTYRLAVCPNACYSPPWLTDDSRLSGVITQLYSVRSESNFGIGDFADLKYLITHLKALGFDSVGLNPLHTLLPNLNDNCSPYSPSSRLFINPLYVSFVDVPEYQSYITSINDNQRDEIYRTASSLRALSHVDYPGVHALKVRLFEGAFHQLFSNDAHQDRQNHFEAYLASAQEPLKRFALIEAMRDAGVSIELVEKVINESEGARGYSHALNRFESEFRLKMYAQWLASEQFEAVQQHACELGLNIGVVNDLAVGADRAGSEVLANPESFCANAAVGAPPDEIAPVGQNWGIPPVDPTLLKRSGYAHFINLLRSNMQHCGALRIDHVMGLMRLWWCPLNAHADRGAYVYYPFDEILNLLKLESHINKCAVIGEDLGIVPENFRETLRDANVLSNKVFYFERHGYAVFKHPVEYDDFALAMINNHDVPTLASWWNGEDIQLRDQLGAIEVGKTADDLYKIREDEKGNLVSHLVYADMLPEKWKGESLNSPADQPLVFSIISWVAQARSKLFVIQLEDLILMTAPVNVPGTFKEYPNWKRKIEKSLEEIFSDESITSLLKTISQKRRNYE